MSNVNVTHHFGIYNHLSSTFDVYITRYPSAKICDVSTHELCPSLKIFNFLSHIGDGRVNENVALMGMHTAFMREHNRIEAFLHELNPHWDGKRLLQEARRILIAKWQHIVYNEYLPAVVGPFIMSRFGITLQNSGYYDGKRQLHAVTKEILPMDVVC